MSPDKASKLLFWLFRINAMLLASACIAIFLPNGTMSWIHARLGMGEFPDHPIAEYLARSTSMMYTIHGFVLLYISLRFEKFKELVPFLAWVHAGLGLTVFCIDIKSGMPWFWTVAEGPGIVVFAFLLLWLYKQATAES